MIQRLDDGSDVESNENKDENQLPNGKTDQISGLFEKFRAFCSGWKKAEANSDTPAAIFGQKMNTRKVGRSHKNFFSTKFKQKISFEKWRDFWHKNLQYRH